MPLPEPTVRDLHESYMGCAKAAIEERAACSSIAMEKDFEFLAEERIDLAFLEQALGARCKFTHVIPDAAGCRDSPRSSDFCREGGGLPVWRGLAPGRSRMSATCEAECMRKTLLFLLPAREADATSAPS